MSENERYIGQHESIEPGKSANLMADDAYEFLKRFFRMQKITSRRRIGAWAKLEILQIGMTILLLTKYIVK